MGKYHDELITIFLEAGEKTEKQPKEHPARESAPLKNGWLLQQDIKERTKIPETKIPSLCKELVDKGYLEEKEAEYTDERKVQRTSKARRIKRDKATVKKLFNTINIPYFMSTQYYLTTPAVVRIIFDFRDEIGIYSLTNNLYKPSEEDDNKIVNREERFFREEFFILSLPDLFLNYLYDKKTFKEAYEKIVKLFKSKDEAGVFFLAMGSMMKYADSVGTEQEEVRKEIFEKAFIDLKQEYRGKGYREALMNLSEADHEALKPILEKSAEKYKRKIEELASKYPKAKKPEVKPRE